VLRDVEWTGNIGVGLWCERVGEEDIELGSPSTSIFVPLLTLSASGLGGAGTPRVKLVEKNAEVLLPSLMELEVGLKFEFEFEPV
jgi:hypothetical protein